VYDGEVLLDTPRDELDLADAVLQEFYVEQVLSAASDAE
jgi:hypothetical protein